MEDHLPVGADVYQQHVLIAGSDAAGEDRAGDVRPHIGGDALGEIGPEAGEMGQRQVVPVSKDGLGREGGQGQGTGLQAG